MKKIISMLLVGIMCVSLSACGGSKEASSDTEEKISEESKEEKATIPESKFEQCSVGDTIETDVFKYTLTDLEFVEGIQCDAGNDFFIPGTEGSHVLNGGEGNSLLYFTFEYEYIGKSSLDSYPLEDMIFVPSIVYEDYNIDCNYFVFWREAGGEWYNLSTDVSWAARQNMGLDYADLAYTYEPLTDKTYEMRGTISVPAKAVEDTETEMSINFQLLTNVENNNYQFDLYNFKIR